MNLLRLYRLRWWLIYLPLATVLIAALAGAMLLWEPLPPQKVVIGTGPGQSSYLELAKEYANRLDRMGIATEIVSFPRPQEPLDRLGASGPKIDATFAQGLYASPDRPAQALAVVGHEIVWIFARTGVNTLADLRGKRIAASVDGSSNRLAANALLAHARISPTEVTLSKEVGNSAIAALADQRVDAVIHVATGASNTVNTLVRMDGVHLIGVDHAGALAARAQHLRAVVMPQGSVELRSDLPSADLPTMVTLTHLVVRPDMHPALQRALLDVADELHVMAGFLERQGVFPTTIDSDFPVSPIALRHQRGSRPWLETLLPYRTAQWAALVLYVVLPLSVIGVLLLHRAPRYFDWRVKAVLQHFYGDLQFLDAELAAAKPGDSMALEAFARRLDALEQSACALDMPDRFADRWYTLREHIHLARARLQAARSP